MRNLTRKAGPILTALFAAMCFATMADASDIMIRGIVTDNAGKADSRRDRKSVGGNSDRFALLPERWPLRNFRSGREL